MKKLLFLFTTLLLISCQSTIEADAKKYCELVQKTNEMLSEMMTDPLYGFEIDDEELLFRSYRGGSFEFKDVETNQSTLVSTDSLGNFEFINHPSFITTVAKNFKFKEEYENVTGLIEEEIVRVMLIDFERKELYKKYIIDGVFSEDFFELTHHCN